MAANTLTSVLQDTFHRIETLGQGQSALLPPRPQYRPASSRITDTVAGNSIHDIHKLRPPTIPEDAALSLGGGATQQQQQASKTKYIIGIVVVVLLLVGIGVAIFFIRRKNTKRAQQEHDEAKLKERDAELLSTIDEEEEEKETMSTVSKPLPVPVSVTAPQRPQAQPQKPQAQPQPPPAPPAMPPAFNEEVINMENAVAQSLETQKRLEGLKRQLDIGITSVVASVSENVARTVASQRETQSHAANQEYDENILLNTGTPEIATGPLEAVELPSDAVLETVVSENPIGAEVVGGDDA